jgi:hypothetical protein
LRWVATRRAEAVSRRRGRDVSAAAAARCEDSLLRVGCSMVSIDSVISARAGLVSIRYSRYSDRIDSVEDEDGRCQ